MKEQSTKHISPIKQAQMLCKVTHCIGHMPLQQICFVFLKSLSLCTGLVCIVHTQSSFISIALALFSIFLVMFKVTGYSELYDCIYVYNYATKTGILKSQHMKLGPHKHPTQLPLCSKNHQLHINSSQVMVVQILTNSRTR